jgi:uncharacterized membrane protein YdjX (TVP38/TMEM64 family)
MTPALRRWVPLAILAVLAGLVFVLDLDRFLTLESLRAHLVAYAAAHRLPAAALYMTAYVGIVALSLPGGALMTLLGGFLFGVWLGGSLTVVAATVGATIIFWAARTAFADVLRRRASGWLHRFREGFARNAVSYLLMLRLVPLFPFFIVNVAPAFLNVPLRTYVWTTFLGIIPGTFVYAAAGNGLGAVLDAGQDPDLGLIFTPAILLPLIGLGLLALLPVAARKLGWIK